MDWTAIILAIIGSGTIGALLKSFYDRACSKHDKRDEMAQDIKWLKEQSRKRDIEVSQLKILNLIQHNPKDHKAITMELDHYFLVLKADSWVFDIASDWAEAEKVDISYLRMAHENNLKIGLEQK